MTDGSKIIAGLKDALAHARGERKELLGFDPVVLDDETLHVLWAAMVAMVRDVHAPQDMMTVEQNEHAARVDALLDAEVNRRARLEE